MNVPKRVLYVCFFFFFFNLVWNINKLKYKYKRSVKCVAPTGCGHNICEQFKKKSHLKLNSCDNDMRR
jgi:hypothetical protein